MQDKVIEKASREAAASLRLGRQQVAQPSGEWVIGRIGP
jgi:hypothetical protein